jgi:hypothetical protein
LYFFIIALVAAQGKLMRKFESDPIKYIQNMVSAELRTDGKDIAKRLNDLYLTNGKKFEEQLNEMEKVSSLFKMPIFQITYTKPFLNKFLYCDFLLFSLNL